MTQQALFKLAANPEPLTDRQTVALAFLQAAGSPGLNGYQLGQLMHGHADCRFCKSAGRELLGALKKKGHARQTKGGIFIALELPAEPTTDQDIPF